MTQPRRGLGRGLDALFSGGTSTPPPAPAAIAIAEPPPAPPVITPPSLELAVAPVAPIPEPQAPPQSRRGMPEEIDIDLISPNPDQPRIVFGPEHMRELADSVREHGIIQPLIVTRDPEHGFRLIAGERRLQAAKLVGLQTVPVIFREAGDDDLLELALIENIQRADLNAIEEAMAYRRLTEEHGLTQEETARRVGKSRVTVANALRLLALEGEIRSSLVNGEISEGHARALLGLPEGKGRLSAWREVMKKRLSVRDTEAFVRKTLAADAPAHGGVLSPGAQTGQRDVVYRDIEAQLRRLLGTRVTVVPQRSGARITIDCYSGEELRGVVAQLLRGEDEGDGE